MQKVCKLFSKFPKSLFRERCVDAWANGVFRSLHTFAHSSTQFLHTLGCPSEACRLLADRRCPRSLTKFSFAYGHNEVSLWTGHNLPRKRGTFVRLLWPSPTFPRTMFSLRQACLYRDVDGWGKEAPQGSGIAILATIVGRLEARPLSCPVLGKDVGTTSVGSARGCGGVSNVVERHPLRLCGIGKNAYFRYCQEIDGGIGCAAGPERWECRSVRVARTEGKPSKFALAEKPNAISIALLGC